MRSIQTILTLGVAVTGATCDLGLVARQAQSINSCPGYSASNVVTTASTLSADLTLAGAACNVYGKDLMSLVLNVEYQTDTRIHVKIQDPAGQVYQVPTSVLPRPAVGGVNAANAAIQFSHVANPFSFKITRRATGEVLFDTSAAQMIFEDQYIRLRTSLPNAPHLYGLGEHTDPFMLNTTNYIRTLWSRDAYTVPSGTNLYGNHPVYFDNRGAAGTHGVFLLNSNGMDIKINNTNGNGQYLEYNTLGGVIDLYFMAGPSPIQVAQQYAQVVGLPVMMPYWSLGFHQCRYGYRDVYEVASVVANYSLAGIPLETMWTDIDYMDLRKVFTLDQNRYPLHLVQELVNYLHTHQQHYIVMVDPAVAYQNYEAYNTGVADNAFLKRSNGSIYVGSVWPGPAVFPDWFAPGTQGYWNGEFTSFFNPTTGVDIDGLWIDMNEASNFCLYPCLNPGGSAPRPPPIRLGTGSPIPGFPADFQPQCVALVQFNVNASTYFGENILIFGNALTIGNGNIGDAPILSPNNYPIWNTLAQLPINSVITYQYVRIEEDGTYIFEATNRTVNTGGCDGSVVTTHDTITTAQGIPPSRMVKRITEPFAESQLISKRQAMGSMMGLPGRNLIDPPYMIRNDAGSLSNHTINTDLVHANGLVEYDVHNLYGTMMSASSRLSMLARKPTLRPIVITRSTFAGAGRQVGHWLGDNVSQWSYYRISIAELLEFASLFQLPMVGSDVCGYATNTNEQLCARWAMLGAFSSFYRNHNEAGTIGQEFYRWASVTQAAKTAIDARYKLLDYIYTALYHQTQTGTPLINPMFFLYPNDANTFPIQYQYFYGNSILVSPVTEENSTSVNAYLPNDIFYDFFTYLPVRGQGAYMTLSNIAYTSIPLHIRGGSILPLRANSANTTTELRKQAFHLIIAPGLNGAAQGSLYLDEGVSIAQPAISDIMFNYGRNGQLSMTGSFNYPAGVEITSITVLGVQNRGYGWFNGWYNNWNHRWGQRMPATYNATSQSTTYTTSIPLTGPYYGHLT